MKRMIERVPLYIMIISITSLLFSGCAVIEGIFKVGLWAGIILVLVILGAIYFIMSRFKK